MGEDTWPCVLCTSQPGIWDPEEEERKGGLVAGLGNTRVLYSKDGRPARPRVADLQPQQDANWADLAGLALGSVGTQMGKEHCSQPAEVCLWFEREESLARRRRWPSTFFAPGCHLGHKPWSSLEASRGPAHEDRWGQGSERGWAGQKFPGPPGCS